MTYQRDFARRLNIGVIGLGNHCYRNIIPAMHYLPVKIAAMCDVNTNLANLTAAQYGCRAYSNTQDMYDNEQLDAAILCVSAKLHPKLAMEAFAAGLHVWMEKPVSMHPYEVEEMISKRKDRIAIAGFKKAFMPSTEKVLEIVNSDPYGGLQSILAVYPMSMPENGKEILEQGIFVNWLGNGCHPLSLMMAVGGKVGSVVMHRDRKGRGALLLEFVNGVSGTFHFASGPQPVESYRFFGENWHMHIENSHKVTLQRGIPFEYNQTFNYVPEGTDSGAIVWEPQNCLATLENKAIFTQGIYGELKYFCDCVMENRPAQRGSLEFALEIMKVYEAALLSQGTWIDLQ